MKKSIKVECILFRKKGNRVKYLLLKCTPKRGGIWQPITGSVNPSDRTIKDAAYREVWEEAGVVKDDIVRLVENVHKFQMKTHHKTGKPIVPITEYCFGFEVKPNTKITLNKCNEHIAYRWLTEAKALKMLKWKDNKIALKKLARKIADK